MNNQTTCETCKDLLNEALNLAVRSDQFEQQRRRQSHLDASSNAKEWLDSGRFDQFVDRHNILTPYRKIATKSMTMHLWVLDQYEKDLANWQTRAKHHLMQGCKSDGGLASAGN